MSHHNDTTHLNRAQQRQAVREAQHLASDEVEDLFSQGSLHMMITAGTKALEKMMEEEADMLCGGPKGQHNEQRTAYRHGKIKGEIYLGGVKVEIMRPRVRSLDGGELHLETYAAAQDASNFNQAVLRQCISGVSQRDYQPSMEAILPTKTRPEGITKSSVSRRFKAETTKILEELLTRSLAEERFLVLFLDGKQVGDHHVLSALGVTKSGEKKILGVWEGATENTEITRCLLTDLLERGFHFDGLLVVIDGSKGLRKAIQEVWGDRVYVQRCRVHKKRNIQEKLPEEKYEWIQAKLHRAWSASDPLQAETDLKRLAHSLEKQGYKKAAGSLREGLWETLTVNRLGVPQPLLPTLSNTNTIESAFSQWQDKHHRVKRWRNGHQVLRWAAMGLWEAEKSFHTLRGASSLPRLAQCLSPRSVAVCEAHHSA